MNLQNQYLLKSHQILRSRSSKTTDEKQAESQCYNLCKLMCLLYQSIKFHQLLRNQILKLLQLKFWWKWINLQVSCLPFGITSSKLQWSNQKYSSICYKKIFIRKFETVGLNQFVEKSSKLKILLKQMTSIWVKSIISKRELYDIHLIIKTFLHYRFKKQQCSLNTTNIQYFLRKFT